VWGERGGGKAKPKRYISNPQKGLDSSQKRGRNESRIPTCEKKKIEDRKGLSVLIDEVREEVTKLPILGRGGAIPTMRLSRKGKRD